MKSIALLLLFVLCLFQSCKKDPDLTDAVSARKIAIGSSDPSVIVTDMTPDAIVASWNAEETYNLDLNKDGTIDFIFKANNSYGCAGASQYIDLRIETANSSSYILADSVYSSFCHSASGGDTILTVNALYPKVMSGNDSIGLQDKWRQGNLSILQSIRGNCPPDGSYSQDGKWIGLDQKYIGLRCKNRLGWVKIGLPNNNSIKLYEFALSK